MQVVLTSKGIAPCGIKCDACGKVAKEGQWVFSHVVPNVIHIVFHRACLQSCLDETPDDLDSSIDVEYNRIRQQYINGEVSL